MKLPSRLFSAVLLSTSGISWFASAKCESPNTSVVKVSCKAVNGETEKQHPKKHGVAAGTDCNAIPLPPEINWRECMQTVQYDFEWRYTGPSKEAKLTSITREIKNTLGVYPEEKVNMLTKYYGMALRPGVALKDTYKQIVVDSCLQPISYTYTLDVTVEKPNGEKCTDSASYTHMITADEGKKGYSQFKPQSAEDDTVDLEKEEENLLGGESPSSAASTGGMLKGVLGFAALLFASFIM